MRKLHNSVSGWIIGCECPSSLVSVWACQCRRNSAAFCCGNLNNLNESLSFASFLLSLNLISHFHQPAINNNMDALPSDNSILFGRGRAYNSHPGNLKMRLILDKYRDEYRRALKGEKAKLVRRIYDELVAGGMKFMKQVEEGQAWVEVDMNSAIQKVGHSLRNPKYRSKPTTTKKVQSLGPEKVSRAVPKARPPPEPVSADSSIASVQDHGLDKKAAVSQPLVSKTAAVPQHVGGFVQQNNAAGGQNLANLATVLQNQLVEMELERLRSALPVAVAPPAFGLLPMYSTNQLYGMAEQDALRSLASSNWQSNPVPEDPMFWIRVAAASLSNTGLY